MSFRVQFKLKDIKEFCPDLTASKAEVSISGSQPNARDKKALMLLNYSQVESIALKEICIRCKSMCLPSDHPSRNWQGCRFFMEKWKMCADFFHQFDVDLLEFAKEMFDLLMRDNQDLFLKLLFHLIHMATFHRTEFANPFISALSRFLSILHSKRFRSSMLQIRMYHTSEVCNIMHVDMHYVPLVVLFLLMATLRQDMCRHIPFWWSDALLDTFEKQSYGRLHVPVRPDSPLKPHWTCIPVPFPHFAEPGALFVLNSVLGAHTYLVYSNKITEEKKKAAELQRKAALGQISLPLSNPKKESRGRKPKRIVLGNYFPAMKKSLVCILKFMDNITFHPASVRAAIFSICLFYAKQDRPKTMWAYHYTMTRLQLGREQALRIFDPECYLDMVDMVEVRIVQAMKMRLSTPEVYKSNVLLIKMILLFEHFPRIFWENCAWLMTRDQKHNIPWEGQCIPVKYRVVRNGFQTLQSMTSDGGACRTRGEFFSKDQSHMDRAWVLISIDMAAHERFIFSDKDNKKNRSQQKASLKKHPARSTVLDYQVSPLHICSTLMLMVDTVRFQSFTPCPPFFNNRRMKFFYCFSSNEKILYVYLPKDIIFTVIPAAQWSLLAHPKCTLPTPLPYYYVISNMIAYQKQPFMFWGLSSIVTAITHYQSFCLLSESRYIPQSLGGLRFVIWNLGYLCKRFYRTTRALVVASHEEEGSFLHMIITLIASEGRQLYVKRQNVRHVFLWWEHNSQRICNCLKTLVKTEKHANMFYIHVLNQLSESRCENEKGNVVIDFMPGCPRFTFLHMLYQVLMSKSCVADDFDSVYLLGSFTYQPQLNKSTPVMPGQRSYSEVASFCNLNRTHILCNLLTVHPTYWVDNAIYNNISQPLVRLQEPYSVQALEGRASAARMSDFEWNDPVLSEADMKKVTDAQNLIPGLDNLMYHIECDSFFACSKTKKRRRGDQDSDVTDDNSEVKTTGLNEERLPKRHQPEDRIERTKQWIAKNAGEELGRDGVRNPARDPPEKANSQDTSWENMSEKSFPKITPSLSSITTMERSNSEKQLWMTDCEQSKIGKSEAEHKCLPFPFQKKPPNMYSQTVFPLCLDDQGQVYHSNETLMVTKLPFNLSTDSVNNLDLDAACGPFSQADHDFLQQVLFDPVCCFSNPQLE